MAYITDKEYTTFYADDPPLGFEHLAFMASRMMDNETTSVDGFKKLKAAYPVDPDDDQTVKLCAAALVTFLSQVERLHTASLKTREYTEREDGTVTGKVVASVSSGSESISYATMGAGSASSSLVAAAANDAERQMMCRNIIREYLAGICDANGVHLLYMGVYPYVR